MPHCSSAKEETHNVVPQILYYLEPNNLVTVSRGSIPAIFIKQN